MSNGVRRSPWERANQRAAPSRDASAAEVSPEQIYTEGPMAHEFPRTVSRLREMQSAEFLALARREVDTSLT